MTTRTDELTAADVMSRVLVTVEADESPLMAWELMRRAQVHHLPVVDREGHVEGIITRETIAARWGGGPETMDRQPVGELLGCERHMAARPATPELGREILEVMAKADTYFLDLAHSSFGGGNISGGCRSRNQLPRR